MLGCSMFSARGVHLLIVRASFFFLMFFPRRIIVYLAQALERFSFCLLFDCVSVLCVRLADLMTFGVLAQKASEI